MPSQPPRVVLRPGRDASVLRHHPWIFSGGIGKVQGEPAPGALVAVLDSKGAFLAWGHYSPESQIRVRLVSWVASDAPDTPAFWRDRLARAIELRRPLREDPTTTAYRLVFAESDGVPGLVVDQYADAVVVQVLTAGMEMRREMLADVLWELLDPRTLYERSDVDVREREGLGGRTGLLRGEMPTSRTQIVENGIPYVVDLLQGHKTGFYLDQRENRARFSQMVTGYGGPNSRMLNVFAYSGAFTVCGLSHGMATATNVDSSAAALALGQENLALSGLDSARVRDVAADAFKVLRQLRRDEQAFDVIVVDPPKFAFTQRDVQRAARGYKDINMQAIHLLKPGGLLFTFSCSGAISEDLFQKIIFGAALDTGRDVQIVGRLSQGSDHPVALTFPEGAYLKGLICRAAL